MRTQKRLQDDAKIALKKREKEKVLLLRTVLGELDRLGRDLDDNAVDKVVRAMWTTASELDNEFESDILEPYLLKRMSDDEIDFSVRAIVTMGAYKTMKDLGSVMREFKEKHKSTPYDGEAAASTVRKWLLK
jgi:uncharacterized protein YqeY